MVKQNRDPKTIALWRYEQIEPALHEDLLAEGRGRLLKQISKSSVLWPSGEVKPVSLPTLYRWLEQFDQEGLEGLKPEVRSDRGQVHRAFHPDLVESAIKHLSEDPAQSLYFLIKVLEAELDDEQLVIAPSTLQRRLAAHPDYPRIQKARKRTRRRTRFCARAPHDIWQTDAKGPVTVKLISGLMLTFHVLSILDDASRAILAAIVALKANLGAAVQVFRMAALRWGLPKMLYADRASIFDSMAFRSGLAQMGSYRIPSKPRNAEARGKIEAYHGVLDGWFFDRLPHQQVVDQVHLLQLLNGILDSVYQTHKHRSLGCSPQHALGGVISPRAVPPTRLYEAFRQERKLKAHRKTGEVVIDKVTYLVPDMLRGQRLCFLVDPPGETEPLVKEPMSSKLLSIRRAQVSPQDHTDVPDEHSSTRWGAGPLQVITDKVRGKSRPLGEPGFGLPEIYVLLGELAGRHVPQTDAEAALIQRFYREEGPWGRAATEAAISVIRETLGHSRPIKTYLEALVARVVKDDARQPQEV
jgi:transposase InsO family protein